VLRGDAGTDTLAARDFLGDPNTWIVSLAAGTSSGQGSDTLSGFENIRESLSAMNNLIGSASANDLRGGQNADVLMAATVSTARMATTR
jgi:hypothetical protein